MIELFNTKNISKLEKFLKHSYLINSDKDYLFELERKFFELNKLFESIYTEYYSKKDDNNNPLYTLFSKQIENLTMVINKYFDGQIDEAYKLLNNFVNNLILVSTTSPLITKNILNFEEVFYRTRIIKDNHKSKNDLLHIPFNKRELIRNQRFSISGIPCLYLSNSMESNWRELEKPNLNNTYTSGFKFNGIKVLNLSFDFNYVIKVEKILAEQKHYKFFYDNLNDNEIKKINYKSIKTKNDFIEVFNKIFSNSKDNVNAVINFANQLNFLKAKEIIKSFQEEKNKYNQEIVVNKNMELITILNLLPLIISTSFKVRKNKNSSSFSSTYLISQMLMNIINQYEIDGIMYNSKNNNLASINIALIAKAENKFSHYSKKLVENLKMTIPIRPTNIDLDYKSLLISEKINIIQNTQNLIDFMEFKEIN